MWSSYLKTSLQTLWRDRWYTALNVLGLAIGIAAGVLIFTYIRFETSYDEFHDHADSTFFEVFSFPLRRGNPRRALRRPFTIVLTESLAQKHFGQSNPVGESVMMQAGGEERAFEITGVTEDPPPNTHLAFRAIISFATREAIDAPTNPWPRHTELTYALLEEGVRPEAFTRELRDLIGRHLEEADPTRYHTQPLTAIHLDREVTEGFEPPARPAYLYIFGTLALLLLVLAGVNYVNMATAQATRRAANPERGLALII